MVEIKTAYLEEYKETLMDEIMIRYEDEQKYLLMALIKGKMMHLLIILLVFVVIQMTFQLFFLLINVFLLFLLTAEWKQGRKVRFIYLARKVGILNRTFYLKYALP